MIYKTCSINKIIAQVYRDFKPSNSGWIDDCVEWIADAVEIIGSWQGYSEQFVELKACDYRVKIPCEAEMILAIVYKGRRLARNGGITHKNPNFKISPLVMTIPNGDATYSLNPNYIHTPFAKDATITVYYLGLEVDCDGFPYIIDDAIYREALTWYVMMKMLGRGFKHQVFQYKDCMQKWETIYPKAQNRVKMPDIDGMEKFKKTFLGIARSVKRTDEFFNLNGNALREDAFPPGSLLQTFQILGPKTEDTNPTQESINIQFDV